MHQKQPPANVAVASPGRATGSGAGRVSAPGGAEARAGAGTPNTSTAAMAVSAKRGVFIGCSPVMDRGAGPPGHATSSRPVARFAARAMARSAGEGATAVRRRAVSSSAGPVAFQARDRRDSETGPQGEHGEGPAPSERGPEHRDQLDRRQGEG